jgi:hypothetical protein
LYGQVFFPGLGVLPGPGSFFNTVHRGTLPLANVGTQIPFPKVGTVFNNWLTIGLPGSPRLPVAGAHVTPLQGGVAG